MNSFGSQSRLSSGISGLDEIIEGGIFTWKGIPFVRKDVDEKIRQKGIPLLIVSAKQSASIQKESIKRGASGVLVKPLVRRELSSLINGILEE
ncbi:MAG: hypothetical protein WCI88_07600 [Chloroflexota bacterium]